MKKLYLILLLIIIPAVVFAASYTTSMIAPTEYTDNTPLPASDIDHYTIYSSPTSGGPYTSLGDTKSLTNNFTLRGPVQYFVATVTTVDGLTSDYSNEVVKFAPKPKPPVLQ